MRPAIWRALALTLIALGVAFVCYQTTIPDREDYGISFAIPRDRPDVIRVTRVRPQSQAAQAGIKAGDIIAYGRTAVARAQVLYATAGSHVNVRVNDNRNVTLVAHNTARVGLESVLAIRLAFLLVAALLAWRRPDDRATRALVVFLSCYGVAIALSNGVLPNPLLSLIVLQIGSGVVFVGGTAAAAEFAAFFPSGAARPAPRNLATLSVVLAVLTAAAVIVGEWLPNSGSAISFLNFGFQLAFIAIGALVVATLVVAYRQGELWEKQRRRWVFLMLGVGMAGPLIDVIVQQTIGFQKWIDDITLLPLGIMPLGLAYVILRHRIIDVGFVLNRAVVYGGVSIIIVGVFLIVETLMAKYVEAHSHVGSLAVQLAVALILGFSVRFIHARVDRFVDTVFFRERHEAESAMRDFAFDAPYITEAGVLLRRCVDVVRKYAHAADAGVWLREDTNYSQAEGTFVPASVDENDPAIVAMRSRRVIAELHSLQSSLPGTLGFPMIVRGELIGMLLCGPKVEDETYAPDERDALSLVATGVAHALDGLRIADLEQTVERLLAGRPGGATQGAMGTF